MLVLTVRDQGRDRRDPGRINLGHRVTKSK